MNPDVLLEQPAGGLNPVFHQEPGDYLDLARAPVFQRHLQTRLARFKALLPRIMRQAMLDVLVSFLLTPAVDQVEVMRHRLPVRLVVVNEFRGALNCPGWAWRQ